MTTISDIAKRAGVSVTTVSKVINKYPDVNSKTRKKIMDIIDEMEYRPNVVARGLVKGRSWTVGIFLTTPMNHPFFSNVLAGMREILSEKRYDLIFLAQNLEDHNYNFVNHCLSRKVDGVLVFGFSRNHHYLTQLLQSEIPAMLIDIDLLGTRTGNISFDHKQGIAQGVRHFYQLGHRKIAMIAGHMESMPGRARLEGYQDIMTRLALPYDQQLIAFGDYSKRSGYQAMKRLMESKERPTAVMCSSDLMAIGAIKCLEDLGLRVPHDIAIIGFDDSELSQHVRPSLSTIRQDQALLGHQTIEKLISLIDNPHHVPTSNLLPTQLMIRESCGARLIQKKGVS